MIRHTCGLVALIALFLGTPLPAETITIEQRGPDLLESATHNRFIAADRGAKALRLAKSYLITNEMGVTAKSFDAFGDNGAARVFFHIPTARFNRALLLIYMNATSTDRLPKSISVNGHTRPYVHDEPRMLTGGWARFDIPAGELKAGANEIVIRGGGLHVDTFSHAGRSARSFDSGLSFRKDALGPDGLWSGEYMVRLRVYGHPPAGEVTSDVIGAAAAPDTSPVRPEVAMRQVTLHADQSMPHGTLVDYSVRSGSTPAPSARHWSDWRRIENGEPASIPGGRYLQWRARLTSDTSLRTPAVRGLRLAVEADVHRPALGRLHVDRYENPKLVRGSYPFTWESDTPRIRYLADKYDLRGQIRGDDQLSQQMALRDWVSRRWDDGWSGGRYNYMPPWDALQLLEMAPKHLSWGMCTLYSCTYVQTAIALGFNARSVIIDHHCAAEVWSDPLGKWILQDPGPGYGPQGYPIGFAYQAAGKWLNALEVHQALGDKRPVSAVPSKGQEMVWKSTPNDAPTTLDDKWMKMFARFGIPLRNNHLSQPEPAELEHGRDHFHWDGYLWWSDSVDDPKYPEYSNLSNRLADFYWPLNRVAVDLQQPDGDSLIVGLDTLTPNLARYEAAIDEKPWATVEPGFRWALHQGSNRLRIRTVNVFGRMGQETVVGVSKK